MEQQAILLSRSDVEWPSLDDRLGAFADALVEPPRVVNPEELDLRAALGLRT